MLKPKILLVATVESTVTSFLLKHLRFLATEFDLTVVVNTSDIDFLVKYGVDVKVISVHISRKINLVSDFRCLVKLVSILIKERPVAVHSITPKAGFLAMLASFMVRIPLRVHTFTGQVWVSQSGFKRMLLKFIDKFLGIITTHNIVDSPSQRDFLIKENVLTEKKSIVFGSGSVSGVDLDRFKPNKKIMTKIRAELSIPENAFLFIYLGRLNRDKGVLDLAHAFAKIQNNKAFLLIVGSDEGGFVDKMKAINAHKSTQLRFVGFTNRPEEYLATADALCLPSYREGFGSVVIEAAAIGIPAIASDIYGISDAIINQKTGVLHTPKDANSIANVMQNFLKRPELVKKYGDAARERVKAEFDANVMSKYWLDFYFQAIGQR